MTQEQKINIAELLKNCPTGMELDCTIYDNVTLNKIDNSPEHEYPIQIATKNGYLLDLTKYGTYTDIVEAKCVIFPKGKTTWEGFHRPFEDGDVVVAEDAELFQLFLLKHLTHSEDENDYDGYCYFGWDFQCNELFEKGNWGFNRLATEEEKQKLFDAIKENGYKWNEETKTLRELVESNEDVDDRVVMSGIYFDRENYADEVELHLNNYEIEIRNGKTYAIFKNQKTETLKAKFKIGDKIKRKGDTRLTTIKDIKDNCYIITIPDVFDNAYITDKLLFINQNEYELVPNKFDINTLDPIESKVLVRDTNKEKWTPIFWGFYDSDYEKYPYVCCGNSFAQCIPYTGNEHLLGTTNDCDEFYKTW